MSGLSTKPGRIQSFGFCSVTSITIGTSSSTHRIQLSAQKRLFRPPFVASISFAPGASCQSAKVFAAARSCTSICLPPTPPAEYSQPSGSSGFPTANVAAAVAYPPSMVPGPDPMGAPTSFTARRPNASHLPSFELPPPPLAGFQHKYQQPTYPHINTSQPSATTLTSVGNLLTPPSNGSADGSSPGHNNHHQHHTTQSHGAAQTFTPTSSGMWPPPSNSNSTPYGFQPGSTQQPYNQGRGLYSPSLNSIVRGSNSPTASEGLPPPPYEMSHYSNSTMSMSAPSLPAMPHHQQMMGNGMMGGHGTVSAPSTQPSPVHSQESFARPPPTPTYYNSQQSSTPQQPNFPYSSGPSPIQQSPNSAGGPLSKMSPANQQGQIPSLQVQSQQQSYAQHRPYSYQMPVLTNVNNPGGQVALVGGGMPHTMMHPSYNSGHGAQYTQMYAHHPQQSNPPNDRPFRCDQCPQSFNRNHDLKRHKRIHLAVKPFPCGHCDKSFSRKDALKVSDIAPACKYVSRTDINHSDTSSSKAVAKPMRAWRSKSLTAPCLLMQRVTAWEPVPCFPHPHRGSALMTCNLFRSRYPSSALYLLVRLILNHDETDRSETQGLANDKALRMPGVSLWGSE